MYSSGDLRLDVLDNSGDLIGLERSVEVKLVLLGRLWLFKLLALRASSVEDFLRVGLLSVSMAECVCT